MSESINLIISILALTLSILSAAYTWIEHRKAARVRLRDEIIDALASFENYKTVLLAMSREREKTGTEMSAEEKELFETFEKLKDVYDQLSKTLRSGLKSGFYKKMPELELVELRSLKQTSDSFTLKIEMFFERFKRFNDNRLPEMREELRKVQELMASFGRG